MNNLPIITIMPVYLGLYEGCASKREIKFSRAVNSWKRGEYKGEKFLIIVSDGCELAHDIYKRYFEKDLNIYFIKVSKQPLFSGNVRNAGLEFALDNILRPLPAIVTYLDSDDLYTSDHLQKIANGFGDNDWIWFDDQLVVGAGRGKDTLMAIRQVSLKRNCIGTSNVAHKLKEKYNWKGCDGYGHDWTFIEKLINNSTKYEKRHEVNGYIVCHAPNSNIDY